VSVEFFHGAFGGEWLARLAPDVHADGRVYVVEFQLFEVRAWEPRLYTDAFQSEPAEPEWTGSVRFDGCMNYSHQSGAAAHSCGDDDLRLLAEAFVEVRRRALEMVDGP